MISRHWHKYRNQSSKLINPEHNSDGRCCKSWKMIKHTWNMASVILSLLLFSLTIFLMSNETLSLTTDKDGAVGFHKNPNKNDKLNLLVVGWLKLPNSHYFCLYFLISRGQNFFFNLKIHLWYRCDQSNDRSDVITMFPSSLLLVKGSRNFPKPSYNRRSKHSNIAEGQTSKCGKLSVPVLVLDFSELLTSF